MNELQKGFFVKNRYHRKLIEVTGRVSVAHA